MPDFLQAMRCNESIFELLGVIKVMSWELRSNKKLQGESTRKRPNYNAIKCLFDRPSHFGAKQKSIEKLAE